MTPAQVSALAHECRQTVVRVLCERDGACSLSGLALRLSREHGCSLPDAITQLRTLHLSSLESAELIEFDPGPGTVELHHGEEHAQRVLARAESE